VPLYPRPAPQPPLDQHRSINAVAESFFASLKAEWVDHQDYVTHDIGHASVGEYIDRFYNPTRRHSHLDYVSPIEFELRSQIAAFAA